MGASKVECEVIFALFDRLALERRSSTRRQSPFDGSMRQVRGDVLAVLRTDDRATVTRLARDTGHQVARVREALDGLTRDGVVEPGPRGTYRLPV